MKTYLLLTSDDILTMDILVSHLKYYMNPEEHRLQQRVVYYDIADQKLIIDGSVKHWPDIQKGVIGQCKLNTPFGDLYFNRGVIDSAGVTLTDQIDKPRHIMSEITIK